RFLFRTGVKPFVGERGCKAPVPAPGSPSASGQTALAALPTSIPFAFDIGQEGRPPKAVYVGSCVHVSRIRKEADRRLWWQSSTPIALLDGYRNTLAVHLAGVKRPETEIHINGVDDGSMDLHYNAVVAINTYGPGGVLNKVIQASEQGYDAVAIGCFLD